VTRIRSTYSHIRDHKYRSLPASKLFAGFSYRDADAIECNRTRKVLQPVTDAFYRYEQFHTRARDTAKLFTVGSTVRKFFACKTRQFYATSRESEMAQTPSVRKRRLLVDRRSFGRREHLTRNQLAPDLTRNCIKPVAFTFRPKCYQQKRPP
jgi:hypothetical protein